MRSKKKIIDYTDWIANLYPEYRLKNTDNEENSKKILTRNFTFQVTDACNLACTYCYQINKKTRRMSFEVAKQAVDNLLTGDKGFDQYFNCEEYPAIILEFIGGEPFLEIELIDKTVDYFREKAISMKHPWANKFMISICSNGVLYRDPRVQRFLQKNYNVISFSVTVDGTQELHDACRVFPDGSPSYHIAHDAAIDWINRGYSLGSKITIAPDNVKYLSESLFAMIEDGYFEINANCVFEEGWKLEHAQEFYRQCKMFTDKFHEKYDADEYSFLLFQSIKNGPMPLNDIDNWCGGTGQMLAMDPEGKLYPCLRYMESSLGNIQKPMIIGDVFSGLMQKECEKHCVQCLHKITRRTQSTDQCFYCPIASGCAWCSAHNYQVFGTVDKRSTFTCDMHKAQTLGTVYYFNKYHQKMKDGKVEHLWVPKKWAIPIIGEGEYEMLATLTRELGGYVNEDATMVKIEKSYTQLGNINLEDVEVLRRD